MLLIRAFEADDEPSVISMWRECKLVVPQNDPHLDIKSKMTFQPDLFLVGLINQKVVASVMAGYEGHRGWLNYLAVAPEHQKRGYGRAMVEAATERLRTLGCPKINLQVRSSNSEIIEFYRRIGFSVDDVVSLGKRLKP